MPNYVVGHNLPGYLPESDPWITDSWESARDALIDDLERLADHASDLAGDLDLEAIDEMQEEFRQTLQSIDRAQAELRALPEGFDYLTYADGLAYWLSITDEEVNTEDE